MEHNFKFEKLIVWQSAMEPGENIHELSPRFPKKEVFNLTSQISRASDSTVLNISGGSIGQSVAEQKNLQAMPFVHWLKLYHVFIKTNEEVIYQNQFSIHYILIVTI